MGLGIWEVLLILGVILVFFGSRKLPQLTKAMGEAKREFKKSLDKVDKEDEDEIDVTESSRQGRIGDKNGKSN